MSLKSFRDARSAFVRNLNGILAKLNYTPASLSMKLNNAAMINGSSKSVVSAADIQDWTSGKRIPSLYAAFKLCDYLRVTIDELLDPKFNLETVVARSFAIQVSTPKITSTPSATPITDKACSVLLTKSANASISDVLGCLADDVKRVFNTGGEEFELLAPYEPEEVTAPVAKKKDRVPSSGRLYSMEELRASLVDKHSLNSKRNDKLAYAILTSGKSVKQIASLVGASPTAMRDYMYYGVTVPETVAKSLLKVLRTCNYAALGLKYDTVKSRYVHA